MVKRSRRYRIKRGKSNRRRNAAASKIQRMVRRRQSFNRKAIKAVVRAEIAHNAENFCKQVNSTLKLGADPTTYGLPFDSNNIIDVRGWIDQIPQGVTQESRRGNTIKLKRFMVKGYFYIPPIADLAVNNAFPCLVRWRILKYKPDPEITASNLSTNLALNMFQFGSTTTGMTGTMSDMIQNLNSDRYVWKASSRDYKVGRAEWNNSGTSASSNVPNNDYKLTQKFKINCLKHMPKKVKYDDYINHANIPKIFILFQAIRGDGGNPIAAAPLVYCRLSVEIEWEDG